MRLQNRELTAVCVQSWFDHFPSCVPMGSAVAALALLTELGSDDSI